MKKALTILLAVVLCFVFVACSNTADKQITTLADSTSSNDQIAHSTDNIKDVTKAESTTSGYDNKNKTKTESSNSVDIIRNETTSENKTDGSVNSDKNEGVETDNNQVDIDNIIGGDYF